jgi:hypothetical protein
MDTAKKPRQYQDGSQNLRDVIHKLVEHRSTRFQDYPGNQQTIKENKE